MTYRTVVANLLEAFPELRDAYETERRHWSAETPDPYTVYREAFDPYIEQVLDTGNEAALTRVFDFLERMAQTGDTDVVALLGTQTLEHLAKNDKRLEKARGQMGPATLALSLQGAPPDEQ